MVELAILGTPFPLWDLIWGVSQGDMLGHGSWYNDYIHGSAPHIVLLLTHDEAWRKNGLKLYVVQGMTEKIHSEMCWGILRQHHSARTGLRIKLLEVVGFLGGEFWLILCSANTPSSGCSQDRWTFTWSSSTTLVISRASVPVLAKALGLAVASGSSQI